MRAILLFLALGACAAAPPGPEGFRRVGAPIASAALFDPARFVGTWEVVLETPGPEAACPATVVWERSADGYARSRCPGPPAPFALTGPGRFAGPGAPVWVLWVDADYRTAVIGTPDGSFARVLNRGGPIPADRLTAAREILDFNGYDADRLIRRDR